MASGLGESTVFGRPKAVIQVALAAWLMATPAFAQGGSSPTREIPDGSSEENIALQIGEQRVISGEEVRSYSEGAPGIVDVRLTKDASEFVVVALAPGTTTLLFIMVDGGERRYRFTVTDPRGAKAEGSGPEVVEARDNVRLDFYFVQLSRSHTRQLGLAFPASIASTFSGTYDLAAGALDSATAVITDQALPRLDMAESAGFAKVLRKAAVVTANGEKASFSGGGEVNIAVQTALTSAIHKIPFGSVIDVEPHYDSRSGRIELKLHADISELTDDGGSGVPGRTTSALDTVVNIELGQSLILAGLTEKDERGSRAGVPGLSQIPILGLLFGTHGHTEDESENIVVIVPSVVDAVSMEDKQRLDAALQQYSEFSGDIDAVKFVPEPNAGERRRAP